jgi:hypothetical protein
MMIHPQDEDPAHGLPPASHHVHSTIRICKHRPEIRRFVLFRVFQSAADREESGHDRLEDEPKLHGSADATYKILKYASQQILHGF